MPIPLLWLKYAPFELIFDVMKQILPLNEHFNSIAATQRIVQLNLVPAPVYSNTLNLTFKFLNI